tara:strand:+ start:1287 stop:2045 length:759 start_codon:yes stop_codon:yes gene_type:complete
MTIVDAIILGVLQGITEFLPVSSSGHLVLAQEFLGINEPGNSFEIVLHLGTLLSVLVVFQKDIFLMLGFSNSTFSVKYILYIIIGTLPAGIIGIIFKDFFALLFENRIAVGYALICTSLILFSSFLVKSKNKKISFPFAFIIGCFQAIAIIPGISRSGITICMGILFGLSAKEAARFSFMLAIPIILGAGLLDIIDNSFNQEITVLVGLSGLVSSFFVGLISLKWLLNLLEGGKLYYFGIYCFLIGMVSIFI